MENKPLNDDGAMHQLAEQLGISFPQVKQIINELQTKNPQATIEDLVEAVTKQISAKQIFEQIQKDSHHAFLTNPAKPMLDAALDEQMDATGQKLDDDDIKQAIAEQVVVVNKLMMQYLASHYQLPDKPVDQDEESFYQDQLASLDQQTTTELGRLFIYAVDQILADDTKVAVKLESDTTKLAMGNYDPSQS